MQQPSPDRKFPLFLQPVTDFGKNLQEMAATCSITRCNGLRSVLRLMIVAVGRNEEDFYSASLAKFV